MKSSRITEKAKAAKEKDTYIREIIEVDGEVEIDKEGEFLIIRSLDSIVIN